MINEERVKQEYKIAIYEQREEKRNRQMGRYYRSDYIGKEIIKSIFSGTIAYAFMALLWAMSNWSEVLSLINSMKIVGTVIEMVFIYIGFIALYLFITYGVYALRYKSGKKKLEGYRKNLKVLHQMYEREENLKM